MVEIGRHYWREPENCQHTVLVYIYARVKDHIFNYDPSQLLHQNITKWGHRTWGSKSSMFSSWHVSTLIKQERACGVLRTPCSLPFGYQLPQNGRENVGSKNPMFSSLGIPTPIKQEREHGVLRTSHSLSVTYQLAKNRRKTIKFLEPHILFRSCTKLYKTGQNRRKNMGF